MKFFLLYLIGLVNLALGFFVVRRLRSGPTVGKSPAVEPKPAKLSPSEALDRVRGELRAETNFMAGHAEALEGAGYASAELANVSSEVNVAADRLLKTMNTASAVLSQELPDDSGAVALVQQLEDLWGDISAASMQLVTQTFDGPAEEAQAQLRNVCLELQGLCERATEELEACCIDDPPCEE